jgi:hypothetical protein
MQKSGLQDDEIIAMDNFVIHLVTERRLYISTLYALYLLYLNGRVVGNPPRYFFACGIYAAHHFTGIEDTVNVFYTGGQQTTAAL